MKFVFRAWLAVALKCVLFASCGRAGFEEIGVPSDEPGRMTPPITDACFDGVQNQDEAQIDCGGSCPACADAKDCAELLMKSPGLSSDVYQMDIDAEGPLAPYFAYCEMVEDGGGWTLVAKVDGSKTTFHYDSPLWTDNTLLNPQSPHLDNIEGKFLPFTTLGVNELRFGLRYNGETRWLLFTSLIPFVGSLREIFEAPAMYYSPVSRDTWVGLIPQGALQSYCNRDGINVWGDSESPIEFRARIGILSNETDDCYNMSSVIGVGFLGAAKDCGFDFNSTAGNVNACDGATNQRDLMAMAYIMIR